MKKRQKNKKNPYQNKTSHEFIRWGTLGPQIHKEASLPSDSDDRDFHIAPTKKRNLCISEGIRGNISLRSISREYDSWKKT
jgi:hypothetical protein